MIYSVNIKIGSIQNTPTEILLFREGPNLYWGYDRPFTMDKDSATQIMAQFAAANNKMVIDWEHQSEGGAFSSPNGLSEAAGWISGFTYKPGIGLFANYKLTQTAMDSVKSEKYKYYSPVFMIDKTGKIIRVKSVALTNTPRTFNLPELVAAKVGETSCTTSSAKITAIKLGELVMDLAQIVSLLGLPDGSDVQAVCDKVMADPEAAAKLLDALQLPPDTNIDDLCKSLMGMFGAAEAPAPADSNNQFGDKFVYDPGKGGGETPSLASLNAAFETQATTIEEFIAAIKAKLENPIGYVQASQLEQSNGAVTELTKKVTELKEHIAKQDNVIKLATFESLIGKAENKGKITAKNKDFALKLFLADEQSFNEYLNVTQTVVNTAPVISSKTEVVDKRGQIILASIKDYKELEAQGKKPASEFIVWINGDLRRANMPALNNDEIKQYNK